MSSISRKVGVLKAPTSVDWKVTANRPSSEKPAEWANSVCEVSFAKPATVLTRSRTSFVRATPVLWNSKSVKKGLSAEYLWQSMHLAFPLKSSQPRFCASVIAVLSPLMNRSKGELPESRVRSYAAIALAIVSIFNPSDLKTVWNRRR